MSNEGSAQLGDRRGLASRFGISVKMVDRMNAIGVVDGVPPPWGDVEALAGWYRERYRSDAKKPPTQRGRLPEWLQRALESPEGAGGLPVPVAAGAVPDVPMGPVGTVSAEDALATARRIVEARRIRWEANRGDLAAQREYLEAFEKLQKIEDRSRKAGDTEEMASMAEVQELVAKYNARIPRRFEAELLAALPEVRRAVETAQMWQAFATDFVSRVCRKLVDMNFADVPE